MNRILNGWPVAQRRPVWGVSRQTAAVLALGVAALLSACDASNATSEPQKQAAKLPKGFIQVRAESIKMLEIAPVADPQGLQIAWAPAHVAFVEDRVASVSVPVAAWAIQAANH